MRTTLITSTENAKFLERADMAAWRCAEWSDTLSVVEDPWEFSCSENASRGEVLRAYLKDIGCAGPKDIGFHGWAEGLVFRTDEGEFCFWMEA